MCSERRAIAAFEFQAVVSQVLITRQAHVAEFDFRLS